MTSPAQPGIGDAYKLHHVMGHDLNRIVDRLTSLREARKSPEGKARIAKLLEDRKRQQAEIDAKKESKNDI
jgi:hypothetical protein